MLLSSCLHIESNNRDALKRCAVFSEVVILCEGDPDQILEVGGQLEQEEESLDLELLQTIRFREIPMAT